MRRVPYHESPRLNKGEWRADRCGRTRGAKPARPFRAGRKSCRHSTVGRSASPKNTDRKRIRRDMGITDTSHGLAVFDAAPCVCQHRLSAEPFGAGRDLLAISWPASAGRRPKRVSSRLGPGETPRHWAKTAGCPGIPLALSYCSTVVEQSRNEGSQSHGGPAIARLRNVWETSLRRVSRIDLTNGDRR